MNDKILIVLIIAVSVIIIILYISVNNEENLLKNTSSINSKEDLKELFKNYNHKIINNKDLIEESNNIESKLFKVCEDALNITKDSIYSGVYILKNIMTKKDCLRTIYEAEKYAKVHGGWKNGRHEMYPTHDIDIRNIYTMENYIYHLAHSSILPKVAEKFNLNLRYLGISEIFIVKYCKEGQTKLVEHEDGHDFSFIIPLNKDYVGGGTKFKFLKDIVDPDIGNCTIFCGKHRHKGVEIKSGERYILAGFLNYGWNFLKRDFKIGN
tara:strand:+ start:402 stop:1202 length:801 start_codon:yes stop_codon:yes gene_type:complete